MTTRTHTQKDGTIWEWEETPELREWIINELSKRAINDYTEALNDLSRT